MIQSVHKSFILALGMLIALGLSRTSSAQDLYFPLNQRIPTGMAARWSALTHPTSQCPPQLVQISLPGSGTVTFYQGSPHNPIPVASPARAGMATGSVYRVRISDMPGFPGVELYPTIELIDRLNPPPGLAEEFPIPIEFTEDEIETVLQNRMVTKVVYLEHPDLAAPVNQTDGIHTEKFASNVNLLQAADQRGRPMAIVRIGGRIPDPRSPQDEFYSQSPLLVVTPPSNEDASPR